MKAARDKNPLPERRGFHPAVAGALPTLASGASALNAFSAEKK